MRCTNLCNVSAAYFTMLRFDLFLPLHRLWLGYMSELLALSLPSARSVDLQSMPNAAGMQAKLVKADFHGCIMTGASIVFKLNVGC